MVNRCPKCWHSPLTTMAQGTFLGDTDSQNTRKKILMRQKLKLIHKCLFIGKKKTHFMLICCKTPTGRGQQLDYFKRPLRHLQCDVTNQALKVQHCKLMATEVCKNVSKYRCRKKFRIDQQVISRQRPVL